jgi:hypothetical protein
MIGKVVIDESVMVELRRNSVIHVHVDHLDLIVLTQQKYTAKKQAAPSSARAMVESDLRSARDMVEGDL